MKVDIKFKELFDNEMEKLNSNCKRIEEQISKDLIIDDINLDGSLVAVPRLQSKYIIMFNAEVIKLKDLYALKEAAKLERWRYYLGRSSDKYYQDNGAIHEKILKTDVEKYLNCDEKIGMINSLITVQKNIVDMIEKTSKELGNRGFHIKSIIDWRRFTSGV